jgi:hypothetical protein
MSEPRVIKKYPNRRLYDTVESRYITLADVRRLVVEKIDFLVIDKKSQEDITRTILLQVITPDDLVLYAKAAGSMLAAGLQHLALGWTAACCERSSERKVRVEPDERVTGCCADPLGVGDCLVCGH